ncbi:phosphoglucosamine mutase, partial [Gammaproteobacteria bacterium]|nr:phosphoglucosamine mutase [Gammaproteobacteria bacterium]
MPKRYFGTDGIRGEFGVEPLTNEFFVILGIAIGKSLLAVKDCKKKIIFGCDTRESCSTIIHQISIGLLEEGCEIHNTSVVPTPAIAFYTKKENYDLGIMV